MRRKSKSKTRPNTHPSFLIKKFAHDQGIDFVVFDDGTSMNAKGLDWYELVQEK